MKVQIDVVQAEAGLLAEGPLWDEATETLYWVDIPAGTVHALDTAGARRSWDVAADVGCIVLRRDGGAVVALRHGLHALDLTTGAVTFLADAERDDVTTRYNDGKCDPSGRLWVGTLDDEDRPTAALYRLDADHSMHEVRSGVRCSNGLGWSPDGGTLYWTDSPTRKILAFDYDADTGEARRPRELVGDERGLPDGLAVDAEGCIWSARWDGDCVVRYAPDGRVLTTLPLPVSRPTSVAFGGAGLDHLYITSAAWKLTPPERERQPLAGALFVCRPGVQGMPAARFAG
ncbi:MAG TPA: SMP-30/gluconolactonase/LRE family protein [Solirubrobacteraceae bacterium]